MQKLDKIDEISRLSNTNDTNIDIYIPQNIILQIHDPKSDSNCRFRSLAIAIFGDEECWQKIKTKMIFYLNEQHDLYKKLEYDVSRLKEVLSYTDLGIASPNTGFILQNVHS
ncbi:17087_t:CDS:1 [Dentiscutata erythropus]|uniref:17087_t:CDS:1 n=1 Tax=Dentiscutata erythropus TaxID=1348616 RepID=A0A9N8VHP2_9GLOM|nr:17087_t:CDS:1 [Dentiscutata erythropus]